MTDSTTRFHVRNVMLRCRDDSSAGYMRHSSNPAGVQCLVYYSSLSRNRYVGSAWNRRHFLEPLSIFKEDHRRHFLM